MSHRTFASDNNSGVSPEVLVALAEANHGHVRAYGDDPVTAKAVEKMRQHFGAAAEAYFVFNGTGANVLCLKAMTQTFEAVICSELAHINVDECGAPERFTGCKLLPVPAPDGKLTPDLVERHMHAVGSVHHSQPQVISITQSTEMGTVYTPDEIRALADYAHNRSLYLHVDGARFSNAAASLGVSLQALSADAGIDALTFGGTKNGLMLGEAVVVFNPEIAKALPFLRKQSAQLASKMRFLSAQFTAYLEDNLWLRNAEIANRMARLLESQAAKIPGVHLTQPVQANALFAILPAKAIEKLKEEYFFYTWDYARNEVRWVCSFDTTEQDVADFIHALRRAVNT